MTGEKKASATKYHRRALMTVADRLLVEHGYDGMNMNMLAKEANYSKATVYVYFKSKDEIVGALAAERLELMCRELKLVSESDLDTAEKFAEYGRVLTEFATEDRVYFDFTCARVDAGKTLDGLTEVDARLTELVQNIFETALFFADRETVLGKWYAFYGKIKTEKMFGS